jgi:hypothetical protein
MIQGGKMEMSTWTHAFSMWMNTVQRTKETAGQDIDEGAI